MMFLPFQYTNYIPAMVWTGSNSIGTIGMSIPQAVVVANSILTMKAYDAAEGGKYNHYDSAD